jgi:glycosyltransferase involved in cell wall biosynthesis
MKIGYLMQAGVADVRHLALSGPANHVKQVFDNLRYLGHQIRLIAYLDGQIWKSDDLVVFEPVNLRWFNNYFFRRFESGIRSVQSELQLPYAAFFESLRFFQACRQELPECDVLYERMGWFGYGGGLAARFMGIPLVLEVNGDHLSELEILGISPKGLQRYLSTILMEWAAHKATHVVASGEGWRKRFIERWRVFPEKVSVIENGSEMVDLLSRDQLRSFGGSENDQQGIMVLYIGAFEPWHGVEILVRAFANALTENTPMNLILIGSGSQQQAIEKLICNLKLNEYVTLTGQLNAQEISKYLASSDIGVSPYCGRVEYSGLKLLDYKSAGLAVIASGENGQPAIIQHGQTGWIVPPCDEEALSEAIVYLADNVDVRRQIGTQARLEAEQCHSWRHTTGQLEIILKQVIEN